MKTTGKKRSLISLSLVLLLVLAFIAGMGLSSVRAEAAAEEKTIRIAHISDMHVMINEYCNIYSGKYVAETKVTKLLEETQMISEAVFEDIYNMNENAPMYVFITGDITSNGEYDNHVWLSKLYKAFTERMRSRTDYDFSGFQIFLSPGNHDLYNTRAKSYMPTQEELDACGSDEEKIDLLRNYDKRPVPSITSKQFMDLYKDFGYCDCPDRKNGHHLDSCGMASGCRIEYFFESPYWYDKTTSRDGQGLEVRDPSAATLQAFKDSDKDYNVLNPDARFGACSYIARMNDFDVVSFDANTRGYKYEDWAEMQESDPAIYSCGGWHESTGGMISEDQLRWAVSSVKTDVQNDKVVFALGHTNFLPHFDTEDEVISLFTYDNWEEASYTLADAGIRYLFSGHQHASDIVSYVTQKGNVVYDMEACSLASYGCSWRTMDLKIKKTSSGVYTEDFESLAHNLNTPHFKYGVYDVTGNVSEPLVESPVALFTGYEADLMPATILGGNMTLKKKTTKDVITGEEIGIADYLAAQMYNMASSLEHGMPGEYVGEKIYGLLDGLTSKMDKLPYTKGIVSALVSGLKTVDLCKFSFNGNNHSVSASPVKGYDLADFTEDLARYLMQYDFSGSQNKKLTLAKAFLVIYGGHLSGAHGNVMDEEIAPLIDMLKEGRFVRFVVELLEDALLPQLEVLLDTPIRFNKDTPALDDRPHFDISEAIDAPAPGSFSVDTVLKGLIVGSNKMILKNTKNGYSSLRLLLGDVHAILNDVLYTDIDAIKNSTVRLLANMREAAMELSFSKYYDKIIRYLGLVVDGEKLRPLLDAELVDKYVTDAFCKNLGAYGARILLDLNVDQTDDGSRWVEGDRYTRFPVENYKHILSVKGAFNGHTFMRDANGKSTIDVVPTTQNGMLPGLITVSFNEDIYTEKNVTWFTAIQVDVFDKDRNGKYAYSVPDSYIRYSENEDMSDATIVEADGENVQRVLPTIDLGIAFFNMNHAYKNYNKYTVTLDGLKKGTTYYYQLGKDGAWTKTFRFATASDGEFSFMAITDIQGSVEENYLESYGYLTKVLEFFGGDPAFIVSGGDNVDNGKNIMQYTWLFDDQQEVWANNTFISAVGNHEESDHALDSLVSLPAETEITEDTGYYYSYDYNSVHFVVLNTNDLAEDNTLGIMQREWLKEDLQENNENDKTKWTVVILHKGPYTAGSHAFDDDVIALRAQLSKLFEEYDVDLVLQGHDHTYSVSDFIGKDGKKVASSLGNSFYRPEGVLYINLGTMGDKFYDYIYSDEVDLIDRENAPEGLSEYFTADKNLELTETPVFAKITANDDDLVIKTYTFVGDKIVLVDDITLTHAQQKTNKDMTALYIGLIVMGGAIALGVLAAVITLLAKDRR